MNLSVIKMKEEYAVEILHWEYEKPYDFYNNEVTTTAIEELLNGFYYAVIEKDELIGFFCVGSSAQVPLGHQFGAYIDDLVDIGLGMHPKLVGKGYGYLFFSYILQFSAINYNGVPFRLTVANFNQRAIHLYKKLGFVKKQEFKTETTDFITMVKE